VVKVFGLSTGFGCPMRAVTVYEKEQDALIERGASKRIESKEKER
jgi:hypothetical protein